MTSLPAIPAASLAPCGQYLSVEEIRDRLERIGRDDPEAGHGAMDDLMRAALEAIRDGHPDPQGVASAVLVVDGAEFPRWCA